MKLTYQTYNMTNEKIENQNIFQFQFHQPKV